MERAPRRISETRELSDKELSQITSAMGDSVRLQSINVINIIQANLKAEFAARSKKSPALIKLRKSVAA
jgi:replicative DNA helicase